MPSTQQLLERVHRLGPTSARGVLRHVGAGGEKIIRLEKGARRRVDNH